MTRTTATAWHDRDKQLADWALARLTNRVDVWGAHAPLHRRGQTYTRRDGSTGTVPDRWTAPLQKHRGSVFLSLGLLRQHFSARGAENVIGTHSTSPDNTCLWGALDIDHHGGESIAPAINLRGALAWYSHLVKTGFHPLLTSSNGKGGFHLRLLLAEPVASERMHGFLQNLVRDHRQHGMPTAPETFPKQARLSGPTQFGNWLRLPGRHHTRDYWSEVWSGQRWLSGAEAVAHILSLTRDPTTLVPPAPPLPPPRQKPQASRPGENLATRIAAYVAKVPNAGAGQGRDDLAFRLAAWLANDIGLRDDITLAWLVRWDRGNRPPKGEKALEEIMNNAKRYGRNAEHRGEGGISQ
jgi:hypothetical protein